MTFDRKAYIKKWTAANQEKVRGYQRAYEKRNPEKRRAHLQKWKAKNPTYFLRKTLEQYGLTLEQYNALSTAQGDVCAICRQQCTRNPRLSVDHDHTTGTVRGLLCDECNLMLGRFKDDAARFRAAAAYLEKHHAPNG